jgi:hypothetical protein
MAGVAADRREGDQEGDQEVNGSGADRVSEAGPAGVDRSEM